MSSHRSRLVALLRLRDFRKLLAVRLLSQLSDGVFQVSLASYVIFSPERQATPGAIASALAVMLLPFSLVGPFTGVLLDRWRRRQVLFLGNLARSVLVLGTAALVVAEVPDWLYFCAALLVTAVNRFILAGLSAALPRVVDDQLLVTANSVSPTLGTVVATAGGGAAFLVNLVLPRGTASDTVLVLLSAVLYLSASLAARRMPPDLLGPEHRPDRPPLRQAVGETARGLADGVRHLVHDCRPAAHALAAVTVTRFCYGVLIVMVLMLSRYTFNDPSDNAAGMATLGIAVGVSGIGFFLAAVVSPWLTRRLGVAGWMVCCLVAAALFVPGLGLFFSPLPTLAAALLLGLITQGAKICTDTIVQSAVEDDYRGRVFALYDVLFNVAFVAAAALTALVLPLSGQSVPVVVGVAVLYGLTAVGYARAVRRRPPPRQHSEHAPAA
ncbi:MFS transporter [Peterkaempfera bronchialis]|uniref:MFS transporter n=1 Tax=Peterkaempfera bronchialis TaxID=2126346 RepID=A0A345T627_9ACTN|nr:MFS transporter [Peterkaempfera bronchialis]AXI81432.1 MFS transporter [Peterkaempfera bronchialis]